jgi:hypothetical protein
MVPTIVATLIAALLVCAGVAFSETETAPTLILEGIEVYRAATSDDEFEKAVALFEKAARIEPDYVPARVWLGIAYMESALYQERRAAIIEQFEKALQMQDPQGKYERYTTEARQRLLRLRGWPKVIALCLDTGFSSYGEAGERILDGARSSLGAYRVVGGDTVGYQPASLDSSLYDAGRRIGVGWIAIISIVQVGEPTYKTDKKGRGYWVMPTVEARVRLLDCELGQTIPPFTASNRGGGSGTSYEEIANSASHVCGDHLGRKILGVVTAEDAGIMDPPGIRILSVPTDITMVFAETSNPDRGEARKMPILVVPLPKSDTGQSVGDEARTAIDAAGLTMRKALIGSGKFAVVSYWQLAKLRDRRPSDWTPDKAIEFARSVGGRCQGVLLTRLTRCDAQVDNKFFAKKVKATVDLEATFAQVNGPPIVITVSKSDADRDFWATESLEEKKQTMLMAVAGKAAEEICRRLQTNISPATIAVTDFPVSKKVKPELASALGSVQQTLIQNLQSGSQFNVPSAVEVNRWTSPSKKDSLARLKSAGMTVWVRGDEIKSIELKIEKKRDQSPTATVKVTISAVLLDTFDGKELLKIKEQSQQTADLAALAKGAKPESSPEVQEAVKKAGEAAIQALSNKVRDFILQHEDQL